VGLGRMQKTTILASTHKRKFRN